MLLIDLQAHLLYVGAGLVNQQFATASWQDAEEILATENCFP